MVETTPDKHVSGFVSLAGRPNAGKSTLLNALVGFKVAIVGAKPQTTRTAIQGVMNRPDAQVVFVDMPGIHKATNVFNRKMMEIVGDALKDRDLILFLSDSSRQLSAEDEEAARFVARCAAPKFLVLTKIDLLEDKAVLLPQIERYKDWLAMEEAFPVSAVTGEGLEELTNAILAKLPEGPPYFPPDYVTDQPERFVAAELIREKILLLTRAEVPHSVAVTVEQWEDKEKLIHISANIYVERPGQKVILIGKGGAMMKRIGTEARREIEALLGRKVFLELFVKVRPKWREDPQFLKEIDWRSMAGA